MWESCACGVDGVSYQTDVHWLLPGIPVMSLSRAIFIVSFLTWRFIVHMVI